jgi:CheY-like chemotaxis protein
MISIERAVERALKNAEVKVAAGWKRSTLSRKMQPQALVVDDDLGVRQTLTLLLAAAGYETSAAQNGFKALQLIKREPPRLLLCDLDMPEMSGREFLTIVRRRFPGIAVIAMSGSYEEDTAPEGVIADAFYTKGQKKPSELFQIAAEVIQKADRHYAEKTLVWARRISTDTNGTSLALITCTDCLRPFIVVMPIEDLRAVHEVRCVFCKSEIQYTSEKYDAKQNRGDLLSLLEEGQNPSPKVMSHAAKY